MRHSTPHLNGHECRQAHARGDSNGFISSSFPAPDSIRRVPRKQSYIVLHGQNSVVVHAQRCPLLSVFARPRESALFRNGHSTKSVCRSPPTMETLSLCMRSAQRLLSEMKVRVPPYLSAGPPLAARGCGCCARPRAQNFAGILASSRDEADASRQCFPCSEAALHEMCVLERKLTSTSFVLNVHYKCLSRSKVMVRNLVGWRCDHYIHLSFRGRKLRINDRKPIGSSHCSSLHYDSPCDASYNKLRANEVTPVPLCVT